MKLLFCFSLFTSAVAQNFLDSPEKIKTGFIPKLNSKNECRILDSAPSMLLCTSNAGSLTALDPTTLNKLWTFGDDLPGEQIGDTGVAFGKSSNTIMYGTTEGEGDSRLCRVHAVSATSDLNVKWTSDPLDGGCSGTPVISSKGDYVFLTHNFNETGTFTILDGTNGEIFWQNEDTVQPLSPPGIYHDPLFGNYAGGEGNKNDIVIYANKPFDGESGVGNAGMYGFQFPIAFTGTAEGLSVITLRELDGNAAWQAITPPTITDGGRRMYWGVTKSQIRGWPWLDSRDTFDRAAGESLGFERASRPLPKSQPIYAKVATTTDLDNEIILTGSAANEFTALSRDSFDETDKLWNVTLSSPVLHQAQISPDNSVVYFVEEAGKAYAYNIADGTKKWDIAVDPTGITPGYTQSLDGSTLYFAVAGSGFLYAYKVAEVDSTTVPVVVTDDPTVAPTETPVVAPTETPVVEVVPTVAPISPAPVVPTLAPISPAPISPAPIAPTAPTKAPITAAPVTARPVQAPTSGAGVAGKVFTFVLATALVNMMM